MNSQKKNNLVSILSPLEYEKLNKLKYPKKYIAAISFIIERMLDSMNTTGADADFLLLMFSSFIDKDMIPHCKTFEEEYMWFYKTLEHIIEGKDHFLSYDSTDNTIRKI